MYLDGKSIRKCRKWSISFNFGCAQWVPPSESNKYIVNSFVVIISIIDGISDAVVEASVEATVDETCCSC